MRLSEVSPNTIEGSFSDDLVLSKIWLIRELSSLRDSYGTIYVLGSWFGNLALLMVSKELRFDRIINVDLDGKAIADGKRIIGKLGLDDQISSINADVNHISYTDLGEDGLVVNTSCNNIEDLGWFGNIPKGAMVALQSRNNDPGAVNQHRSISDFTESYKLSTVLFKGEISLEEDGSSYDRFMLIGIV